MDRRAAPPRTAARLKCLECGAVSDESARGWRAYLGGGHEDDGPLEVGIYCPDCSQREFASN
jgi:hypothetical protein